MPIVDITLAEVHGGLAASRAQLIQVKWQSIITTVAAGLGNRKPFIESKGRWAHTALLYADPTNVTDILFGPDANAHSRTLPPGTEYLIPAVYPYVGGTWTAFDLGDWYFCCAANAATLIIMYV